MELIKYFIVNLFITAVAYLLVPIIISIIKHKSNRPLSHKDIRKIVIINGACVWTIFQIIRIEAGQTGTSGAVFLWSGVAYWIMKKMLLKEKTQYTRCFTEQEPDDKSNKDNYYKEPIIDLFQIIDKKERRYKSTIAIISLLLVLSVVLNIYQVSKLSELEHELELFSSEKMDFFDECIVFVEDDGTNLYHKYECFNFEGSVFWAHNVEYAIFKGYTPCPICCKE